MSVMRKYCYRRPAQKRTIVAAKPTAAHDLFSKSGRERQKSAQTDAPEG